MPIIQPQVVADLAPRDNGPVRYAKNAPNIGSRASSYIAGQPTVDIPNYHPLPLGNLLHECKLPRLGESKSMCRRMDRGSANNCKGWQIVNDYGILQCLVESHRSKASPLGPQRRAQTRGDSPVAFGIPPFDAAHPGWNDG